MTGPGPLRHGAAAVALVLFLAALVSGCSLSLPGETVQTADAVPGQAAAGPSGLPACRLATLPAEVAEAVEAVRTDGPYLRPRADGGTFGNREGLLPAKPSAYYREYTVEAPQETFPGPRRLVTGGQRRTGTEPEVWFYTEDHYESFCELIDA